MTTPHAPRPKPTAAALAAALAFAIAAAAAGAGGRFAAAQPRTADSPTTRALEAVDAVGDAGDAITLDELERALALIDEAIASAPSAETPRLRVSRASILALLCRTDEARAELRLVDPAALDSDEAHALLTLDASFDDACVTAPVQLRVTPPNSIVLIDSARVSPSVPLALPLGEHTFLAAAPGYMRTVGTIAVARGATPVVREIALHPEPRPSTSPDPDPDGDRGPAWPWLAAGGALLASGAVVLGTGLVADDALEGIDEYYVLAHPERSEARVDRLVVSGAVLTGAGAVLLAWGVFVALDARPAADAGAPTLSVPITPEVSLEPAPSGLLLRF